jgi:hypothetical protein
MRDESSELEFLKYAIVSNDELHRAAPGLYQQQSQQDQDSPDHLRPANDGTNTYLCPDCKITIADTPSYEIPPSFLPPPQHNTKGYWQGTLNIGPVIGWSPTLTVDDYGNVYGSLLGFNVGKSSTFFSGSLARGEMDDYFTSPPPENVLINNISGHSINFSAGYWLGFGKSWTFSGDEPFKTAINSGWSTQAGLYSPQIGLGYNYTWRFFNAKNIIRKITGVK